MIAVSLRHSDPFQSPQKQERYLTRKAKNNKIDGGQIHQNVNNAIPK